MAMHPHGCCLLQRCIDHSGAAHKTNIVMKIADHAFSLALDPFGNYVIQYILKMRSPIINSILVSKFLGRYITLSMQKFSSNVVETCLEHFGEEGQAGIVQELLLVPQFEELLQDQYANYVIKAALNRTKGDLRAALEAAILPHIALRNHPHCRRIFSIILRRH
ncbi:putative pumilio homolog 8, chloroplastic [Curcuma longa]|uniref:putative pumilio homolog 8, chloroplastic n=1 Tax=Curcuma longa TaxID=136217 RepID=UPI003D9F81F5